MKRLFTILAAVLLTASVFAQSPEMMSYQAVIRNSSDVLVTDTQVGMQISILQGTADGSPVYVETQTPTTNANGLVSIEIGAGTTSDDFTTIDWANGPYFIKTETDPAGSTNYTITGVSQLLSVPYALHAKTAEMVIEADPIFNAWDKDYADLINTPAAADGSETKVTAGINVTITGSGTTANPYEISASGGGATRYVGELFGGGIVFYVDETGEHGLIASLDDLDGIKSNWDDGDGAAIWSNNTTIGVGAASRSYLDGSSNTDAIISQSGHISSAAKLCVDYSNSGFDDWYLPSLLELGYIESSLLVINRVLANDGDPNTNGLYFYIDDISYEYDVYWSSTEVNDDEAYVFSMTKRSSGANQKTETCRVRAIRAF